MSEYQQIKLPLHGDSPLQANNEVIMNLVNINTALNHLVMQLKDKHSQEIMQLKLDLAQKHVKLGDADHRGTE